MATVTEVQSLEELNYKTKIKFYFLPFIVLFLFITAFFNDYPVGAQLKSLIKNNLKGSACRPDYNSIRLEWFLPKLVVTDLSLPAACLGQTGTPIKFSYLSIHFNFISFSPFGVPFKIETEVNTQPLTLYFVQGFGERMVRIKDQPIMLSRLGGFTGKFKMAGSITLDLAARLTNANALKTLSFKAQSKDLQLPAQNLQGFTTPFLKINDLVIEANSSNPPRISVDKLWLGDTESPIRAQFKGTIDLQNEEVSFSPLNLTGEVAFSTQLKEQLPLIDMLFAQFTSKDGFYQVRLGGTLGAIKPSAP